MGRTSPRESCTSSRESNWPGALLKTPTMPSLAIPLVCVFAPIFWAVPGVDARGDSAQIASSLPFIQARPAGDPHFYDTYGRVRIFHGSNRVKKASPWYFADMLEKDTEFE